MHYYKRNIGDYAKKAARLSMLQHGAYTLLIDACYDRERFPTLEEAMEWTWASTTDEREAVEFVLRKFFTLIDGKFVQKRIQEEVEHYYAKAENNKRIAQEREAKRKEQRTNRTRNVYEASPDVNETPPNHKPLTTNQEPTNTKASEPPLFAEFWSAYPKKVGKPAAMKAFRALRATDETLAQMLAAIQTSKHSDNWQKQGGQFIPNPATWLNQRRWEDQITLEDSVPVWER